MDIKLRSFVKGVSYRISGSLLTILIVLIMTGSWQISVGVSIIELMSKCFLYYFHERIWNRIKWGKDE